MKKWNRVLAILLAVTLALGLTACSSAETGRSEQLSDGEQDSQAQRESETEKSLYEHGMDLIALMRQAADSREMLAIMLSVDDVSIMDDMMASEPIASMARMGRQSDLKCLYQIKLSAEAYRELAESHLEGFGLDPDCIPAKVMERRLDGLCGSMLLSINYALTAEALTTKYGYGTMYTMALYNSFQYSNAFVSSELRESMAYLYVFEGVAVMETFTKNEDNVVTVTAAPVFVDEIVNGSRSQIEQLLQDKLSGITVEVNDVTP